MKIAGGGVTAAPLISVLDHDEIVLRTFLMLSRKDILASAKFESELKREDLRTRRHYNPEDSTKFPDLLISLKRFEQN